MRTRASCWLVSGPFWNRTSRVLKAAMLLLLLLFFKLQGETWDFRGSLYAGVSGFTDSAIIRPLRLINLSRQSLSNFWYVYLFVSSPINPSMLGQGSQHPKRRRHRPWQAPGVAGLMLVYTSCPHYVRILRVDGFSSLSFFCFVVLGWKKKTPCPDYSGFDYLHPHVHAAPGTFTENSSGGCMYSKLKVFPLFFLIESLRCLWDWYSNECVCTGFEGCP